MGGAVPAPTACLLASGALLNATLGAGRRQARGGRGKHRVRSLRLAGDHGLRRSNTGVDP